MCSGYRRYTVSLHIKAAKLGAYSPPLNPKLKFYVFLSQVKVLLRSLLIHQKCFCKALYKLTALNWKCSQRAAQGNHKTSMEQPASHLRTPQRGLREAFTGQQQLIPAKLCHSSPSSPKRRGKPRDRPETPPAVQGFTQDADTSPTVQEFLLDAAPSQFRNASGQPKAAVSLTATRRGLLGI